MELIEKADEHVVVKLEHLERLYIMVVLSFATWPFINEISDEERQYAFSGSRGAEALKELFDPGWRERTAKYEEERKEAKVQGRRWSRSGKGWPKEPFLVKFSYQDLLSIKRLLDLVIPNRTFDYYMDPGSIENVKGVQRDIVQMLDAIQLTNR